MSPIFPPRNFLMNGKKPEKKLGKQTPVCKVFKGNFILDTRKKAGELQ